MSETNTLSSFLERLREKWREVPGSTQDRAFSGDLLQMPDAEFIARWQSWYENNCAGENGYPVRGWYHDLYAPLAARGGRWVEIGSGLGYDGTFFAEQGAHVTFVDIVESNLKTIERVCRIRGIRNVEFVVMRELADLNQLGEFDTVLAVGSLINAPFEMMCEERRVIASHLRVGGRWLELCYPRERWEREGSLPFSEWGKRTDGERTPWVEWYDLPKLTAALQPHRFDAILDRNFHNNDFNWFDLIKRA
ncbi:MAG: class I SAM-dependent methyltransferase [Opitutae bacterium]|nr:class I SAM-dependent methyltransferase [Opitutae bacterium]